MQLTFILIGGMKRGMLPQRWASSIVWAANQGVADGRGVVHSHTALTRVKLALACIAGAWIGYRWDN